MLGTLFEGWEEIRHIFPEDEQWLARRAYYCGVARLFQVMDQAWATQTGDEIEEQLRSLRAEVERFVWNVTAGLA